MNNQNENEQNNMNVNPQNTVNTLPNQNNPMENQTGNVTPQAQKPTLDSILNANGDTNTPNPISNEPVVNPAPVQNDVTVETIPNETSNVNNATPVMETIPEASTETVTTNPQPLENPEPVETLETPTEVLSTTPQDDFGAVPVPPVTDEDKKDKKGNQSRIIILILILVLIAAIGFGVYYFLNLAKNSTKNIAIQTKDVYLELGETLSNNIDDYATISGYSKENCTLEVNNIDINKVSTYKYAITCGSKKAEGTAIVDDTKGPIVETTDLTLVPGSTIKPEDFIENCTDATSCSYEFVTDITGLTGNEGEYDIEIVVSDEYSNKTNITAKLIITNNAPVRYMTCTGGKEDIDSNASLVNSYKIGIDANDNFYNAQRISVFTFEDKKDYENARNSYNKELGLHNIIGTETFNDNKNTITIKSSKTLEEMGSDLNAKFPTNATSISNWMWGIASYTCN